jgi:polyketide cyclase/dehydrase/lipid transport protein
MKTTFAAERMMNAPAEVIYDCLANYREHHRPGGFLPPAFMNMEILKGGFGTGTEYRFTMKLGGRRRAMTASVEETVPGHEIVETGSGVRTRFTVEPTDQGTRVRFDTVMEAGGLEGVLTRLFAGRWLVPIYDDELRRLEEYAQARSVALP